MKKKSYSQSEMNVIEQKINKLVEQMTLEEKIGMIHGNGLFRNKGVERLNVPKLVMSDGTMGIRKEFENDTWKEIGYSNDLVTYLPSNNVVAATWNRKLAYIAGRTLGEEARGRGKDVILSPGINIIRTPLCGRNFEYMSEDPYIISEMVVPMIQGIQENDVAACVKHFAVNNQETERLSVDVNISERALREIYFPGFLAAVKRANTYSIMGAYNRLRGEFCCESKDLLDNVLRVEWNYDGAIISDWGAVHNTIKAANCSLDLEMSVTDNFDEYFMATPLLQAVKEGEVKESRIDKKVKNLLRLMYRIRMFDEERSSGSYSTIEHYQNALEIAQESVVLLKNEDQVLPLNKKKLKKIAVIGQNADMVHANGGGSAEVKTIYEVTPLLGIQSFLGGNVEVKYAPGYYIKPKQTEDDINWQDKSLDEIIMGQHEEQNSETEKIKKLQRQYLKEAVQLAKEADQVIFIGGLNHNYDCEGMDKKTLTLPYYQDELIQELLKINSDTIIVLMAGSPVSMNCFSNQAKAIVWSGYAGLEGGRALAQVLFGKVNPSGKLPVTIPKKLEDSPAHVLGEYPGDKSVTYQDDIFVGYRYYDYYKIEPEFCFGHGLSYTEFEYEKLHVSVEEDKLHAQIKAMVTIRNKGEKAGAEIVQLYVRAMDSMVKRPIKELRQFNKVYLEVGESKEVTLELSEEAFSYYDEKSGQFVVEAGDYEILVGSSSKDLRVKERITLGRRYEYK